MTYHPCSAETSRKYGALTYLEPLGSPWPVAGDLYFTYCWASSSQHFKRSWCLHREMHVYKDEGIVILQFTSQYTSLLSKTTTRLSDLLFYFDGVVDTQLLEKSHFAEH